MLNGLSCHTYDRTIVFYIEVIGILVNSVYLSKGELLASYEKARSKILYSH